LASDAPKPAARVVILARGDSPVPRLDARCVRVTTAYEAAAELLLAPTAAMVVEVGLLGPRHLRLLEIARDVGVEVLGVGVLPPGVSAAQLDGVRLVSSEAVASAVGRVVRPPAPAEAVPPPPSVRKPPEAPAAPKPAAAPGNARLAPAKRPRRKPAAKRKRKTKTAAKRASPKVAEASSAPEPPAPESGSVPEAPPRGLLTPEELSALLGDGS